MNVLGKPSIPATRSLRFGTDFSIGSRSLKGLRATSSTIRGCDACDCGGGRAGMGKNA